MKRLIKRSWHWILLLLSTDLVFIFVTWIIRREALRYMSLFLFLFTLFILAIGLLAEIYRQKKDESVLLDFLESPDDKTRDILLGRFENSEAVRTFCTRFLAERFFANEKVTELSEYREYIEAWVHEVKTPLSLSTLVMNNHRDEMSSYVYARLNYVQHQINEDVARILFYARLQSDHSDIKFTRFRLDECISETLEEYHPFIEEKNIHLAMDLQPLEVISDRKTVLFMLSQLMGNAVKYADDNDGQISVTIGQNIDEIHFSIYNNGSGVPPEDLPYIFDRGFTGNYPNRQKATGMGLYLVQKYAEKLCVKVGTIDQIPYKTGFGIEMIFKL